MKVHLNINNEWKHVTIRCMNLEQRLNSKVDRTDDCWIWTASTSGGYGQIRVDGKILKAHRVAYELFVGPIPEDKELDHLCRNRVCVRPDHLEPVTRSENLKRSPLVGKHPNQHANKTHCKHGHEFTTENTYLKPDGKGRECKACRRERARKNNHESTPKHQ